MYEEDKIMYRLDACPLWAYWIVTRTDAQTCGDKCESCRSAIARSLELRLLSGAYVVDHNLLPVATSDTDADSVNVEAITTAFLPVVVVLANGTLPGLAAVGTDFELGDGIVVVHDLHGEPASGVRFN